MSKKLKSIVALCLTVIMTLSVPFTVGASENTDETKIQPRYTVSCTHASGKHLMDAKGKGMAYYGSAPSTDLRLTGQASQCRYCHLVLVTQYNPFYGSTTCWGDYATWNPGYSISSGTVVVYTTHFGYSGSNSDAYVQGFTFNY